MPQLRSLNFLCCLILFGTGAFSQEIGQQGFDPFTGQPGKPVAPVSAPDTSTRPGPGADNEQRVIFKSRTTLIQVPVVVADKSGNHIHNLTKEDFKVLESGKQQKIALFEEVNTVNTRPAQATPSGVFTNAILDEKQARAITVIALDTINTPFLDQSYGRQQLFKYLARTLDSGRIFGLVVIGSKGVQVLSPINSDPAVVIAAIKKVGGEASAMQTFTADGQVMAAADDRPTQLNGRESGDATARIRRFILKSDALEGQYTQNRAIEDTMKAFLSIAWSLSGVPGRKSLIWATGSFPFALDSPASVPGGSLSVLYERTLQALNDAQISVYPVDVRGLVNTSGFADVTSAPGFNSADPADAAGGRSWLYAASVESLKNFAEMTGGRAFVDNNDLAAGFQRAADDSSSYYMLSYYADNHDTKPGWRTLRVQLPGKDVEVRARTGFLVTNATNNPELTHNADVGLALSSPFDSTGIQLTMQWLGIAPDGNKKKIAFGMRLPTTGVIDEADQNRVDVEFIAQATKNGVPADDARKNFKGTISPAGLAKLKAEGISYQNVLDLLPGDYQVRFVVRDNLRGRIGSVSAPLTVQ